MADEGSGAPGRAGEWMRRAAIHYLERYASSEENLRRVLVRKLRRKQAADPERWTLDEAAAARLMADTIVRCRELGLLDDRSYAELRTASGRRRGMSAARIVACMSAKGVPRELAEDAVAAGPSDDSAAALVFARRRRIGPFRPADAGREADPRRELAALCRQGFSYAVARTVVTMDRESAEAALDGLAADPGSASRR